MIDFKCRRINFVFFSVLENRENGFGDEGAMPPEFLG